MMVEGEAAPARFWKFALGVYLPEEARAAFLRLQDRDGADVPLLLFCLWCGVEGAALSDAAMERAVNFSAAWRAERVEPIRRLRMAWKDRPGTLPPDASEAARQQVAKAEQAVERLQMDHLAGFRDGAAHRVDDALPHNIAILCRHASLTFDPADMATVSSLAIAFARKEG